MSLPKDVNFKHIDPGINLVPQSVSSVAIAGDLDFSFDSNNLNANNGTTSSHIVTVSWPFQGADRLQNKDYSASTSRIVDDSDTSKKLGFNLSGSSTGTTLINATNQTTSQSLGIPNVSSGDFYVTNNTVATLTNKTINASTSTITNLTNANLSGSAGITNANLAVMPADTIKGNNTAGSSLPLDLTGTQTTAILVNMVGDSGSGGVKGLVPAPPAGSAASLYFLKADGTWAPTSGQGVATIGTIDSTSPSANGAVIVGSTSLVLQSASASVPGLVNNGTQTFSGAKTFSSNATFSSGLTTSSTISGSPTFSGAVTFNSGLTAFGGTTVATAFLTSTNNTTLVSSSGSATIGNSASINILNGGLRVTTIQVNNTNRTLDTSTTDYEVLVSTQTTAVSITLPPPSAGRLINIKDYFGNAGTNNITILPHASETIDGASSYVIKYNYGFVQLVSDGTNWYVIAKSYNIKSSVYIASFDNAVGDVMYTDGSSTIYSGSGSTDMTVTNSSVVGLSVTINTPGSYVAFWTGRQSGGTNFYITLNDTTTSSPTDQYGRVFGTTSYVDMTSPPILCNNGDVIRFLTDTLAPTDGFARVVRIE